MSSKSCADAVASILSSEVDAKTVTIWNDDNPVPLVSECPAIRLRLPEKPVNMHRLSGDSTGGYAEAFWPLEINVFSFDSGDEDQFISLVDETGQICTALRKYPTLQGLADVGPPGSVVLYSGQRIDLEIDPYQVTEEVPPLLRHATIKYWIREIIDL